jgi:hypothetical protein
MKKIMKNNTRRKQNVKNMTRREAFKKYVASLNLTARFRQAMSIFFIYALAVAPLLTSELAVRKAYGQFPVDCSSTPLPEHIVQRCAIGSLRVALEAQAVSDVIEFYKLPNTPAERARVISHARNEVRGFLFSRFLTLLKKPNPTPAEQDGINNFLARMKQRRVLAAQKAIEEYNDWKVNACNGYAPPAPYTYPRPIECYGMAGLLSTPKPPSFEEFQQFGAVHAYGDLMTAEAQDITSKTTQQIGVGAGAGLAVVGGLVAGSIATSISFIGLTAILPFAATAQGISVGAASLATINIGVPANFVASSASGTVGATAIGGPLAVVIIALTAAVMQGIAVGEESQLPGKLQDALNKAQNDNFNQFSFTYDAISNQQIYSEFLAATLPDFPGTDVPPASPNDRKFLRRFNNGTGYETTPVIEYVDWNGKCHEARLNGGWFVDKELATNVEKQVLSINFMDWNNRPRVASRNGGQFILTDALNLNNTTLVDEIGYKSCSGTLLAAKIKFEQIALLANPQVSFNCRDSQSGDSQTVILGKVTGAGDPPASLAVTVNDQASATVNGITLSDLYVDDQYQIVGKEMTTPSQPVPSDADFTIKVSNSIGSASEIVKLKKSAIDDTLTNDTLINVNVGESFTKIIQQSNLIFGQCSGFSMSYSGELPPGVTFGESLGQTYISGVPISGGKYNFIVHKNYFNGEILSRLYTVNVKSELTKVPNGLNSWWRGENNAEDFNNVRNGTMRGTAGFTEGKVRRGFKFDGANGYVELPNDTFSQSPNFTFETWFKTSASGTILGQQVGVPYQSALGGMQLINVTPGGNLRARMFGGNEIVSTTRVDDGRFHHLAVTYNSVDKSRALYLDGNLVGTSTGVGSKLIGAHYQFGTGVIQNTVQYSNFNGLIDEPALYGSVLTPAEIASIYRSGAAGKMSIEVLTTPTLTNTGTLRINIRGGAPGARYSIDDGATLKDTAEFLNLTPRTYNIFIKDGEGRILRTTAAVPYAQPGFNVTAQVTNPKCNNTATGTITINPGAYVTTGTTTTNVNNLPLFYSINGGATGGIGGSVITNVAPGTYTPWVKHVPSNTIGIGAPVTLINPPPLALSPTNFVNSAAVGFEYNQQFQVVNGTAPYVVTVSQTPPGLTAFVDTEGGTGRIGIRGRPTLAGDFPITITASDGNSCPFTQTLTLTVYDNNCRNLTVQNNHDSGPGSLRQTIADACPEANIKIPGSLGQITLASQIMIDKSLNITGDNPNLNVISGAGATRIFETAANTTVNLSSITLTGGNPGSNQAAGAIGNRGVMTIFNSVIVGNRALSGGAIYNLGSVLAIGNTAILDNFASGNSGAIANNPGSELVLRNVTIANNSTNGAGGGVWNLGTLTAIHTTISGNRSDADAVSDGNGTDGGGLLAQGTESLINSIVAGNYKGTAQAPNDISGAVKIAEYNLIGNAATAGAITNGFNGNIVGNNGTGTIPINTILNSTPALNGGMTPNLLLVPNSPAIDKGRLYSDFSRVGSSDQRSRTRPVDNPAIPNAPGGNGSDIGSIEAQSAPPANSLTINGRITNGGQGLANVLVLLTGWQSATTYTDADGNYSFGNLIADRYYYITPTLNGYTFSSPELYYPNVTESVTGADFVTAETSYEGDIAARPIGNGTVDVFDLVSLGRIIGNLDSAPVYGGEFQRTDVAPFDTRGDGAVNVQDLVQLGNYVGNLTPRTPASGAVAASIQSSPLAENESPTGRPKSLIGNILDDLRNDRSSIILSPAAASLSAGSINATSSSAVVPVNLTSNADTAAIQFTVTYDPSKLSIPADAANSAIFNRFPNTTFVINNNTPGRLGIVAYQPLDGTSVFPTGTVKLFDINFTVAGGTIGTTTVDFGNDPVPQAAANPQAGTVQFSSTSGTVTFMPPTAARVSVSGRVMTPEGKGLRNAFVTLTDQTGATRTVLTSTFGYYRFTEVPAGETFVIAVNSKRYTFTPLVISVMEELTDLNLFVENR